MTLGMIGLGRMGANLVRRPQRGGPECAGAGRGRGPAPGPHRPGAGRRGPGTRGRAPGGRPQGGRRGRREDAGQPQIPGP